MKRLIIVCALFLGMLSYTAAWSHHMAEGIISDEIWLTVDSILDGTPHSEIDLDIDTDNMDIDMDAVWDSMVVQDGGGNPVLVSSAVVETEYLDDYMELVSLVAFVTKGFSSANNSDTDNGSPFDILPEIIDENISVITIYEPLGGGSSQDAPLPDDDTPSKNGKG